MAAPKRPTHTVTHKNLYLKNPETNKMEHIQSGSNLTLSREQAEKKRIGKFVSPLSQDKTTDLTKDSEKD